MADPVFDPNKPAADEYAPPTPKFDPSQPSEDEKMTWGQAAKTAVGNIPHSAAEFAKGMAQPFIHPIDTATGLKNIALGAAEKAGIASGDSHKKYADAVGEYFSNRYGGMENFKKSIAEDPVGVLGDLSTIATGGETALARAPGVLGKVGEVAGTVGRAIDPVANAARVASPVVKGVASAATHPIGLLTGTKAEPIKIAAEAGYKGGPQAESFLANMRDQEPMTKTVEEAKEAVSQLRQQRGAAYRNSMTGLSANQAQYPGIWSDVANSLSDASKVGTFKGVDLYPSTRAVRQKIFDTVADWYHLPANDFHTLEGFDALKKKVGDIRDTTQYGTPERKVADTVYSSIRNAIKRADPEYGKTMEGYEKASDIIREIEDTLSLKPNARIDTSLRKLQTILRDNVNTNFGRRSELAKYLVDAGADKLLYRLAGQTMKPWTPRGIQAGGLGAELAFALYHMFHGGFNPAVLPIAAASSPRLVGEAAYYAGKAAKYFPKAVKAGTPAYEVGKTSDLGNDHLGFAAGGAVKGKHKIGRDAFLYMESNDKNFAQCGECTLKTKTGVCTILAMKVKDDWSCGEFIKGPYLGQKVKKVATPAEVGLVKHKVRCENCKYGGKKCALYVMLNKREPETFDLKEEIKPHACCNAHTPKLPGRAYGGRLNFADGGAPNDPIAQLLQQQPEIPQNVNPISGVVSYYNPNDPRDHTAGGQELASGEHYDPDAFTAAVKTGLRGHFGGVGYGNKYVPTHALVQSGDKKAIVRVNDVGPLAPGRVMDLSEGAMRHFDPTLKRGLLPGTKVIPLPPGNWKPGPYPQGERTNFADGGDPELSDSDQAQSAAEAAAARVRAPYVKANEHESGLPQVLDYYGNKITSALNAPHEAYTGALQVSDPETGMPTPEAMHRAQGIAGLAMTGGMPMAQEGALGMFGGRPTYSAAGAAVQNAKAEVMQPSQWLGYLKNQPGVKPTELEHVDLEPWLKSQEGPVSRETINKYIDSKQPEIKEVRYGQHQNWTQEDSVRLDELEQRGYRITDEEEAERQALISRENAATRAEGSGGVQPTITKYSKYQLPGGKNYGETLLTLPAGGLNKAELEELRNLSFKGRVNSTPRENARYEELFDKNNTTKDYRSSHWYEPNVLLHVRHNDRDIPGVGKSLHLEEVQSDWHQAGRKQGYRDETAMEAARKRLTDATETYQTTPTHENLQGIDAANRALIEREKDNPLGGVPDAPFKQTWPDLALKRMLHRAATEKNPDGSYKYDSLSWTPGEAQAARYDLSKHLSALDVVHEPNEVSWWPKTVNGGDFGRIVTDKSGKIIKASRDWGNIEGKSIHDVFGKEVADRGLGANQRETRLSGVDLKVGGEGMKSFYDKMLVDKANGLTKKYGTKVGQTRVPVAGPKAEGFASGSDVMDWMGIPQNQHNEYWRSLSQPQRDEHFESYRSRDTTPVQTSMGYWAVGPRRFPTREAAQKHVDAGMAKTPIHVLPITPALRKAAESGFPTFAAGGAVRGYDEGGEVTPEENPVAGPLQKLLGLNGTPRYKTFPEVAISGAASALNRGIDLATGLVASTPEMVTGLPEMAHRVATAPRDAQTGRLQVSDPETGMPTPEAMSRANEFAGAVMGTSFPFAEEGALGMAGGKLRKGVSHETSEPVATRTTETELPERGGVSGGERQLEAPHPSTEEAPAIDTESPLIGLPRKIKVPGYPDVEAGPYPVARQAARDYMEEAGLPYEPVKTYAKVNPANGKRIAQAFEEMKHDPESPQVQAAYDAMAKETMAQWNAIKKTGLDVEFSENPYPESPRLAAEDVKNNNHMYVYPTDVGFGTTGITAEDVAKNPLLAQSGEYFGGKPARINDIFRVVHDYFGHIKEGVGFRADGEENAWRSHAAMYSPLARKAMTSETRGQNSWVNWGPHGEKNRAASTPDTVFADQKLGLLPDWVMEEGRRDPGLDVNHPAWIDQRLPTSKKGSTETGPRLVDLDTMKTTPKLYNKNVALVKDYPNMPDRIGNATTDDTAEHFINHVKDNLLWLHDQVPQHIKDRSKLWYEGGRKIVDRWAKEYGLNDSAVAGVMASLSPQMDWFQNVSLARRLLDINTRLKDVPMTPEMEATFKSISTMQKNKPIFNMIKGKSLNDIDAMPKIPVNEKAILKAMWTRLYDEAHNTKSYPLVTPEGGFGELAKTARGTNERMKWNTFHNIAKGIRSVEENGARDPMNTIMGEKHKIRSFYNNLLVPNSTRGDVTIDTHAVAAGLLRPLAGKDVEVNHNFQSYPGKNIPAAGRSAETGLGGTYPLYAEAYRRAAKERNILPREMQSITWEAIRGLFPEDMKNAKFSALVDGIWNDYKTGKVSLDETRKRVLEAGGGIRDPKWLRSSPQLDAAGRSSGNAGELSGLGLHGSAPEGTGPRVGNPTRARVSRGSSGYFPKRQSAGERDHFAQQAVDHAFDQAGLPVLEAGPLRNKVVKIVGDTGSDPMDVYERVIMEGHYGEEGAAKPSKAVPKDAKSPSKGKPPPDTDVPFASGGAVDRAAGGRVMPHYIDHSPSEAQKAAGNYRKDRINWHGMEIVIENAKGSERSGIDKNGKKWSIKPMPSHYGYIRMIRD